jgi:cell division septation protein DedD
MTDLAAHGIEVTLPAGWEGRVFKRPLAGEVGASAADGAPAAAGETTNAVVHVATIPLPAGTGDFASGAVDQLGRDDVLIVLFEYDPASVTQPLFAAAGLPTSLDPDDFNPNVLQRTIRGQAGVQKFFHDQDRAFCLYVVLGAFANRRRLVSLVNQVLDTMTIAPLPGATPSTTSTTAPPTDTTEVPTTGVPTTEAPTTEPPTTTSVP